MHVSTAYCNAELRFVEERVYAAPAHAPLHRALQLAAAAPRPLLHAITDQCVPAHEAPSSTDY